MVYALECPHQADRSSLDRQCSSWKSDRAEAPETASYIVFDEMRRGPSPSIQSHKHPEADLEHGHSPDCELELLYPADFLELRRHL